MDRVVVQGWLYVYNIVLAQPIEITIKKRSFLALKPRVFVKNLI
jgi:hypothetical protein